MLRHIQSIVIVRRKSQQRSGKGEENYYCFDMAYKCVIHIADMFLKPQESCIYLSCLNFPVAIEGLLSHVLLRLFSFTEKKIYTEAKEF